MRAIVTQSRGRGPGKKRKMLHKVDRGRDDSFAQHGWRISQEHHVASHCADSGDHRSVELRDVPKAEAMDQKWHHHPPSTRNNFPFGRVSCRYRYLPSDRIGARYLGMTLELESGPLAIKNSNHQTTRTPPGRWRDPAGQKLNEKIQLSARWRPMGGSAKVPMPRFRAPLGSESKQKGWSYILSYQDSKDHNHMPGFLFRKRKITGTPALPLGLCMQKVAEDLSD